MMSMNLSDIAILNIKGFKHISTIEAINLMQNVDLAKKSGTL